MGKDTFTEEEAIEITIQHGYNGSEFDTALWKQRGCLSTNGTLKGLIRKLDTIYNSVKVEGRGKKRKYILKEKKEQVTEREYNYKGTVQTEDDKTMNEYIFNLLVKSRDKNARPYSAWSRHFELLQRKSFSENYLIELMKELHLGALFNAAEIVSEFVNAINNYNKSIVENSFRRLENEGRITRSIEYFFRTVDGEYEEVNREMYEEAKTFKKELVESYEIKYSQYIQATYSSGHRSNRMETIINEVNAQMKKVFGIDYMYQAIGVTVNDGASVGNISRGDFDQAYFQKFINLAKKRQNRKDYQDTKSFWRRTYLMNTLKMLSVVTEEKFEIDGLDELLQDEMNRKSEEDFLDYNLGDVEEFEF